MPRSEGQPRRKRRRLTAEQPTSPGGNAEAEPHEHVSSHGQSAESVDDGPACLSCRRRKSRCSKQQPCEQCERLDVECTYDERRRPGFKTGAIEALSQRVANLEHMFLGQALLLQGKIATDSSNKSESLHDPPVAPDEGPNALLAATSKVRDQLLQVATRHDYNSDPLAQDNIASTQRDAHAKTYPVVSGTHVAGLYDDPLPSQSIVDGLVDWYFTNIHRWIPVIHQRRFREQLQSRLGRSKAHIVLLSITSVCLRYERSSNMSEALSEVIIKRCRDAVILRSTECFSLESLQALVILAFDIIGRGQGPSSWTIIGSMARTVEQLRLDIEPPTEPASRGDKDGFLMRRMTFLPQSTTWAEEEERRRIYWCVFMLDRFCSVATGWSNSIGRSEVRRRLPCEGSIWEKEIPVQTPYFGSENAAQTSTPSSEQVVDEPDAVEYIGGFAFCLQASDTLNLVTSFFLQREVKFEGSQQVRSWLLKFKELDLRLVKWRLSLPEKWREASVLNQDGIMDPNLTLAHVTQNTAVIQLHQCVAFPPAALRVCRTALPSTSSAETCVSAAHEIGTIVQQFLQQSSGITHPQLGFCLFIAGRVLLIHAADHSTTVHPAFATISSALQEISARWDHYQDQQSNPRSHNDLASRLNSRLLRAQATMSSSVTSQTERIPLDVSRPVYSEDRDRSRATSLTPVTREEARAQTCQYPVSRTSGWSDSAVTNQQAPAVPSLTWNDQANLFTNFDYDADFLPVPQMSGGYPSEGGDMNFDWMSGLEGVFDEQFPQMLRVSTYADQSTY